MKTKIIEAVQSKEHPGNWGKFLVAIPDEEWSRGSEVCPGGALLNLCGWSHEHLWVLDLQTGEGAYFKPGGYAAADLRRHAVWVCVLFEPFLEWLYGHWRDNGGGILDLDGLPDVVELPGAPFAFAGYRRPGPGGGALMGRVQERVAAVLSAEVASRTEWDEPPALFWLALEGGTPRLVPAPVTAGTWLLAPPATVLSVMADACGRFAGPLHESAPDALHGAAFYSETWLVTRRVDDTDGIAAAKADARAHRIHQRPDRTEARTLWAADRAGTAYAAMRRRGIDREPVTKVEYPGPGRTISGDIPAALERIVSAVLAVTMP